jgi:SpoVK/Ycf46/Vps4 family AAA+-type ATPase
MSVGADSRPYGSNYDHLQDELRWLDALIGLRVRTLDLQNKTAPETQVSRTVYITPAEVWSLLNRNEASGEDHSATAAIREELTRIRVEIDGRISRSIKEGVLLTLPQLGHLFVLSSFEQAALVICLAPELRRKYERLYAYLQDDITRKKPSVDLVLSLLCEMESDRWNAREILSEHAPLMHAGMLQKADDPQSPSGASGLSQFLKLDPRILGFLLGKNYLDPRLIGIATLHRPSPIDGFTEGTIAAKLLQFIKSHFTDETSGVKKLVLYLHGPHGVGKKNLGLTACRQLGRPMLSVDMELLLAHGAQAEALLKPICRESVLLQAALYLDNASSLLKEENRPILKVLSKVAAEYGWLVFLAGNKPWVPDEVFKECLFHSIGLSVPDVPMRQAVWESCLKGQVTETTSWAAQLARRFRLTPGQIMDAVGFAAKECAIRFGRKEVALAALYEACRHQSSQKLSELVAKVEPRYGWDDLVLPDDKVAHLREICNQVKHRYRVFGEWGFDKKLSHGKGLSALFFGGPGTGKTMAAQVIAGELQLDLYKIDLSGVISKYIGETEKNLAKIFQEAETSNAILFFDEADALFAKRTEVSDAHDRYANIETSYLLQKVEEYEGVVILATNLRENMDDAFLRRIRFIVEFPFPDEACRLRLWRTHIPKEAPVRESIDYEYLSRELKIAGGSIKNIVVNSAFLAAEDGGVIGMEHLLSGAKREFEKIGKLWSERDNSAKTWLR